jgi:hypothetical protein
MIHTQKEVVKKTIQAKSRKDLIGQFSRWANKLPYEYRLTISINGIISDAPFEAPDEQVRDTHLCVGRLSLQPQDAHN